MIVIDEFKIAVTASYDKWIDCMEEALKAMADGLLIVPQRTHIDFGEDSLSLMPAIGTEYFSYPS